MRFDLVVLDWDGTLMDSAAQIARCLCAAALDCELPSPGLDGAREVIGLGLSEAMQALFPHAPATVLEALIERYRVHFLAGASAETPLFAGVEVGLRRLSADGARLAIATGKSRQGLTRVLTHSGLQDLFAATRTASEAPSKPHPQMLNDILAATGVSPTRALMVGDTSYDMAMARAAGLTAVGVTYGVHSRARLLESGASDCVDAFEDVCRWIGS